MGKERCRARKGRMRGKRWISGRADQLEGGRGVGSNMVIIELQARGKMWAHLLIAMCQ